ncbi:MAG: GTP-binding protein, partial [Bacteroidetes bacterium]|nr:GTP-binding protein [Bacteroidota bacterium]
MKDYDVKAIRNVALIGHGSSGKTSISELLLFTANEINRIGSISEGNTTSDYLSNEIEKQISISSSLLHLDWDNKHINIIDTPGYADFVGEVNSALRITDLATVVLKSAEGVEVGSEIYTKFVKKDKIPAAIIINKVDNEHSNFNTTVSKAKERLFNNASVVTYPVKEGPNCNSVIDVIKMKLYIYGDAGSRKVTEADIPDEEKETAEKYRTELIEMVAESSEELMNKYFEDGTLSDDELVTGLRQSINDGSFTPIFAVSALKSIGINNYLNFVCTYCPSPEDRKPEIGLLKGTDNKVELKVDINAEPVLFIFKTISEKHVGELSIFKVISGTVQHGLDLVNQANGNTERISQLSLLNGHNRTEVSKLSAGDIGAVVKLKNTHTNNTLSSKELSVNLSPIVFPDAAIRGAIITKAKGDEDKIATGLHTLHEEDPSFNVHFDP